MPFGGHSPYSGTVKPRVPLRGFETAPFRGAPQTVALIKRYALEAQDHHDVRLFAEELIQELESKDYLSEIIAIYYGVLHYTRYTNDPRTKELVRRPQRLVQEIFSGKIPSIDCDDMVTLLAALLLSVGREVRVTTVAFHHAFFKGERQFSHVVLQVKEPRKNVWIMLDPVAAEDTAQMQRRTKALKHWGIA